MNDVQFANTKRAVFDLLKADNEKELYCHIQFVVKIGLELAKKYNADEKIIELSCLLHDIGRGHEIDQEDHGDAGGRIATDILKITTIPQNEVEVILACIKNHNKELLTYSLEEKIVITADCASKVLYHEAFMLLCKKQTYKERLAWGKRYLEKGYKRTLFSEYRKAITERYNTIAQIYAAIPASIAE